MRLKLVTDGKTTGETWVECVETGERLEGLVALTWEMDARSGPRPVLRLEVDDVELEIQVPYSARKSDPGAASN